MSGWISVEDELPEKGVAVLICTQWRTIYTCRLPVILAMNSREDSDLTKHERVTHWMPLPEPPEDK